MNADRATVDWLPNLHMPPNTPNPSDDASNELFRLNPKWRRIHESLQDGGPPLDVDPIFEYLGGTADATTLELVKTNIATWLNWHRGFLQCLLFEEHIADE